MQSTSVREYKPEMVFRDGVARSRRVSSAKERNSMQGARARDARSVEQRKEIIHRLAFDRSANRATNCHVSK